MGWPKGRESQGHGVLIVLVGVTPHQGARESRAQGEVAQVVGCPGPARYARCGTPKPDWSLVERCSKATTGELLEIERLTSSLERGHWKSTRKGNSLVAYSTSSTVLNGESEETYLQRQRASLLPTKSGWYAMLADPQMPAMSTVRDQAHNAIDRKLFMMKGFHHPGGSQTAFLTGLAHLYNLIPYQRRALHAGLCGVEVEGGRVPTSDWMLNLQILTSGGYQCAAETPHH